MDQSEQTMRRYLLGELSESEQFALEEEYFAKPQLFNEILQTESKLVDSYVRGQLSGEVRARFEQVYLAHPARRERVKFATALVTKLDQTEEVSTIEQSASRVSWWQRLLASVRGHSPALAFSVALATLLLVIGGIWFVIQTRQRQQELAQTQKAIEAEQQRRAGEQAQQADERRRAEELAAGQATPPPPSPTVSSEPRSVSLALIVGGVRGADNGQIPTLVLLPDTTEARLHLNLKENDFPSYRATLQTITGVEVFSQTNLKPRRGNSGASFSFTVPARKLESGDYVLILRGVSPSGEVEDLSKSLFRVKKR